MGWSLCNVFCLANADSNFPLGHCYVSAPPPASNLLLRKFDLAEILRMVQATTTSEPANPELCSRPCFREVPHLATCGCASSSLQISSRYELTLPVLQSASHFSSSLGWWLSGLALSFLGSSCWVPYRKEKMCFPSVLTSWPSTLMGGGGGGGGGEVTHFGETPEIATTSAGRSHRLSKNCQQWDNHPALPHYG